MARCGSAWNWPLTVMPLASPEQCMSGPVGANTLCGPASSFGRNSWDVGGICVEKKANLLRFGVLVSPQTCFQKLGCCSDFDENFENQREFRNQGKLCGLGDKIFMPKSEARRLRRPAHLGGSAEDRSWSPMWSMISFHSIMQRIQLYVLL